MITLKEISGTDIGYLMESINDTSIMELIGSSLPVSFEEAFQICNGQYRNTEWFIIKSNMLKRNVGLIALLRISFINRSADLSITIPDEQDRHQGYGTQAMYKILYHAFNELFLHRIQLEVLSNNVSAECLYQKLGFHFEGIRREAFFNGSAYNDFKQFSMLEDEWRCLHDKGL